MRTISYIPFRTFLEMLPETRALDTFANWEMVDLFDDYMEKIILPILIKKYNPPHNKE